MTNKVYKTAQGKAVDLGALILQNEKTRAVGNMNVNARGDRLDSGNKVIETKNKQVQRQYRQTSNVNADRAVHTSSAAARRAAEKLAKVAMESEIVNDPVEVDLGELFEDDLIIKEPLPQDIEEPILTKQLIPQGGLAAAIARSKLVKQEKEKTLRERQKLSGSRKI
jgi:aminopeptidase N